MNLFSYDSGFGFGNEEKYNIQFIIIKEVEQTHGFKVRNESQQVEGCQVKSVENPPP